MKLCILKKFYKVLQSLTSFQLTKSINTNFFVADKFTRVGKFFYQMNQIQKVTNMSFDILQSVDRKVEILSYSVGNK